MSGPERLDVRPRQPKAPVVSALDPKIAAFDRVVDPARIQTQQIGRFGYPQQILFTGAHGISSYPTSTLRSTHALRP